MAILKTKIDPKSEKFKSNYGHHSHLSDKLYSDLDEIRKMGPAHRVEKHKTRGKLTARERIEILKDPGSDFLEFSEFAAYEVYDDQYVPAAGIITGIIEVSGHYCIVIANDATVKGGTYYPPHCKKAP